ncbi:MAG TPA: DUF4390 domain-containing protein [Methylotenera sp.]|nr:DUF4390 domain-containing protein [Methylotenera sp.]
MRYYKKTKNILLAGLRPFLIGMMFFIGNASAANTLNSMNSITIKSAEIVQIEDNYVLNADADIKFNDDMEEAILKGFELNFLIEFQLVTPRKYWFDDEIVTVTHRVTLGYHALSRQFLVIRGEQQKTFATLEDAIADLDNIHDLKVFSKSEVEKGFVYKAALLMRLDHNKLPKALQVDAISSDEWKMLSQRYEWFPNLFK